MQKNYHINVECSRKLSLPRNFLLVTSLFRNTKSSDELRMLSKRVNVSVCVSSSRACLCGCVLMRLPVSTFPCVFLQCMSVSSTLAVHTVCLLQMNVRRAVSQSADLPVCLPAFSFSVLIMLSYRFPVCLFLNCVDLLLMS